jgi:histidine triad (HIT) family protein
MFTPLNPVVEGHRLIVPVVHTSNLNSPELEANQTGWALRYFTNDLEDYNLITSKGANATQTIQHLHFHIVPREKDDGLMLPWTNQAPLTINKEKQMSKLKPEKALISSLDERIKEAYRRGYIDGGIGVMRGELPFKRQFLSKQEIAELTHESETEQPPKPVKT